jgi:glycerol-3-phosphate dehydrogenase
VGGLVKALNLVIRRSFFPGFAVGLLGNNGLTGADELVQKGGSMLFAAPWRGHTLVGTSYQAFSGSPDSIKASEADINSLLESFNRAYPPAGLERREVSFVHAGLLPGSGKGRNGVQLENHFRLQDHTQHGRPGLLSVMGVKYTTARHVAERAVDRALCLLGEQLSRSVSATRRLYGGEIDSFEDFLQTETARQSHGLLEEQVRDLVYNYGSAYPGLLRCLESEESSLEQPGPELRLLRAQVRYAVREEMAHRLGDVVFRRTSLGSAGHPGSAALQAAAEEMGRELGWEAARLQKELAEVEAAYRWEG